MVSPSQYTYNSLNFAKMKVNLVVKEASSVIAMGKCPQTTEGSCGIMYRSL